MLRCIFVLHNKVSRTIAASHADGIWMQNRRLENRNRVVPARSTENERVVKDIKRVRDLDLAQPALSQSAQTNATTGLYIEKAKGATQHG